MEGKLPHCVIIIRVQAAYFQCARAVIRAGLWDNSRHVASEAIPTAGEILNSMTSGEIDGEKYDTEWPDRGKASLW